VQELLDHVQQSLFGQARAFMDAHTREAATEEDLVRVLNDEGGFVWASWDGGAASAAAVQEKTKATIRMIGEGERKGMALYAKAY